MLERDFFLKKIHLLSVDFVITTQLAFPFADNAARVYAEIHKYVYMIYIISVM